VQPLARTRQLTSQAFERFSVSENCTGRHRAPGKYNPLSELSTAVSRSAEPAVKTSAVLAASGGLVAAFALPAQAGADGDTQTMAAVDTPAVDTPPSSGEKATTITAPTTAAPAVTAPATVSPAAAPDFGALGFKAVAKPAPKRTVTQQASRSTTRTAISTTTKAAHGGVLDIAASLVGIYYSYGGTSPSTGFDCSGFTQYVFAQVGIYLPRTAEDQRRAVTRVSNPQPGDLVFFGIPAYHVGIYAGNGMMYDSPRTGKAVSLRSIWSSDVSYGRP
jgi:cell wall-associated NlpC family hydrolase